MPVAIRTITRIQDADDINVSLGVGVDEYALCWDNDTAKFVLRAVSAGATDHGALTGLSDDDHTQYALLTGRTGGQTLYGGNADNNDITIHGTLSAVRTTSYVLLQPTAGNVGIGTTSPLSKLHVNGGSTDIRISLDTAVVATARGGYLIYRGNPPAETAGFAVAGQDNSFCVGSVAGDSVLYSYDASNNYKFMFATGSSPTARLTILASGLVGIGTTAPTTILHAVSTTATTNAVRNIITLGANVTSTGVGATGLGAAVLFQAESTTTVDTTQAAIEASWIVATHATRTSRLALKAYDTAEREGIRIDASGTAALLGFYGHAAAARPSAYTPSNVSADRAFDADTVLVAELADVVGTLIADLQSIGLLA